MAKYKKLAELFTPEQLDFYSENIHGFIEDVVFCRPSDPEGEEYLVNRYRNSFQQRELLQSLQDAVLGKSKKRIAAKSAKGVGKTSACSWAVLWFMTCFDTPNIFLTSKSYPTLKSGLWKEIAVWREASPILSQLFEQLERRMYLRESPQTWFTEVRTARDKESLQGLHMENMLIVCDEASGIDQEVFEPIDSTLKDAGKSNNILIMIGNPTRIDGPFYDAFNKFSSHWELHHFSGEDAPDEARDIDLIERYKSMYGRDHDMYKVNILGEFPSGNEDTFFSLSEIMSAVEREDVLPEGSIELGVDVARFGDDNTMIYWRHGNFVYPCEKMGKSSIPEVEELVLNTVRNIRARTGYKDRIRIKVDDTGLAGLVDYLKLNRSDNIEVIGINFASGGDERYHNMPSVMWGHLKDVIKRISIPNDTKLIEELATRKVSYTPSNKTLIQPKREFKKEYGMSPDRADALILCFADPAPDRVVLKDFDPCDRSFIKDNISFSGEEKYCSVYYSDDLHTSIVYGAWDGFNLTVYDEYVGDDPVIMVATMILGHGEMTKILGNDLMFGNVGSDLESQFRKFKVRIRENYNYDQLGGMEHLSNMVSQKRLSVHSKCRETIQQLTDWNTSETKRKTEQKYGLCYALTNLSILLKKNRLNSQDTNLTQLNDLNTLTHNQNRWQYF